MKHLHLLLTFLLLTALLLGACQQSTPSTTTTPLSDSTDTTGTGGGTVATPRLVPTSTQETLDPNCNLGWSRLRVGDYAIVTSGDRANRVRSQPVKSSDNVIGEIYPGIIVQVVAGPVCADGYLFWQVSSDEIPGGVGWTAEGNGAEKHWLDPQHCAVDYTGIYRYHTAIVADGVNGLRVFDQEGNDGVQIGQLQAGDMLRVVDGPFCTDQPPDMLVYWKVENENIPGGAGWVAEFDFEGDQWVRYLNNYWQADPFAFPRPPSLETITPSPATISELDPQVLGGYGRIAYVTNDWVSVVNADGSNLHELLNPLGSFAQPMDIAWAPDESTIAMSIGKRLFLLATDGSEAREPVDETGYFLDMTFSPDSEYLAFSLGIPGNSYDVYVVRPDGTDLHMVNTDVSACDEPDWSPYGTYLLYSCWGNNTHLYLSAYNTPGVQTFSQMGYVAKWSPDGQWIAYNDYEDGLSIMDTTGNRARTILPEGTDFFEWAPDSQSIAFTFQDQIYQIFLDDLRVRNLTGHTISEPYLHAGGMFSWSPDGKYITYAFYYSNGNEGRTTPVMVMDVEVRAALQLAEHGRSPAWSPNLMSEIRQLPDCTSGWTRLTAGEPARVMGVPTDLPNRVRRGPSTSEEQIAYLLGGTTIDVVEGPVCADGLVFWMIESNILPGRVGWTAEGDGLTYWLEPLTP